MQQRISRGKGSRNWKNDVCERARKETPWFRPENVLWKSLNPSLRYKPTPTNLHKPTHYLHTNPTKAPTPYIPTLHYISTNSYMHTLPLHTYQPLQPLHSTLHACPAPAMSMLIGSAAAFCHWWDIMCYDIYWQNYCIWFWLILLWASWRRKGYWIPTRTCNSGSLHNHYY